MARSFDMTAQTLHGLERVLAVELEAIGAQGIEVSKRAVRFTGDEDVLYRANLWLRTALRVLVPLRSFVIRHEDDLYGSVRGIGWERFLRPTGTLAVQCTLRSELFTHSKYLAQLTKDALVDRFRERSGKRPSVDVERPDVNIHVLVIGDRCTVSLDSSGDPLFKRGYRDATNEAPLNETLAAGMVLLSSWNGDRPFVDPMCGSGTLPIEAAMIAGNIPPGSYRKRFGFMGWSDFDPARWERITEEALDRQRAINAIIIGADQSRATLMKAEENIANAHLGSRIKLHRSEFRSLSPPPEAGVLMMNPPYGERMDGGDDINDLYKSIGDTLKKNWSGWDAWMITSNMEAAEHVRLTAKPRIQLFNGSLECRFMHYGMYSGSRRVPDADGAPDND